MNTREYYEAVTAVWKFLKRNLEGLDGSEGWWDTVMSDASGVLKPFRESCARQFALSFMALALKELQEVQGMREGKPRTGPVSMGVTYGTFAEAEEKIRKAEGLTDISFTDKEGKRNVFIKIRETE